MHEPLAHFVKDVRPKFMAMAGMISARRGGDTLAKAAHILDARWGWKERRARMKEEALGGGLSAEISCLRNLEWKIHRVLVLGFLGFCRWKVGWGQLEIKGHAQRTTSAYKNPYSSGADSVCSSALDNALCTSDF